MNHQFPYEKLSFHGYIRYTTFAETQIIPNLGIVLLFVAIQVVSMLAAETLGPPRRRKAMAAMNSARRCLDAATRLRSVLRGLADEGNQLGMETLDPR